MVLLCPMQVSPDGGLLQFSTLSDDVAFTFAGGETRAVPGGYLELAQRQALPQHSHLKVCCLLSDVLAPALALQWTSTC